MHIHDLGPFSVGEITVLCHVEKCVVPYVEFGVLYAGDLHCMDSSNT